MWLNCQFRNQPRFTRSQITIIISTRCEKCLQKIICIVTYIHGVSRKHTPRKPRPQTADLENTDLENTDLKNTDLENTDFKNTDLENADLENADLENIYLLIEKLRPFILKGKKKISKSSKLLLRLVQVC